MSSVPQLFQPIKVGNLQLKHRVVLAPLTRFRSDKEHVPVTQLMKEYYSQRASQLGSLLISEATFIAARAGGYNNIPGIWSDEQVKAWKEITDGVHAKGSFIFLQLWALGRAADHKVLASENLPLVSASAIPIPKPNAATPKELSKQEIEEFVQFYAQAAHNAVHRAGFDGVEVHCANGYLVDQFLQDTSNQRTDEYGGNIENRSRFGLEVLKAVTDAVGEEKTALRVSPFSLFNGMRMSDPIPQFAHFVSTIKHRHPSLAYLHVVEPRISGDSDAVHDCSRDSNDFLRAIWEPKPFIAAGGFKRDGALQLAEEKGNLVAFGRHYISNPDLPLRLMLDIPLNDYNRKTFYTPGDKEGTEKGYIDYPFHDTSNIQGRL